MARPQTVSDEQILSVARECFLEHGPGVSTDVIAQKLHVSPQALLKRFGTKQELMLAAVTPETLSSSIIQLHEGPDDRPLQVQLQELLIQVAVFFDDMARRMAVLRWSEHDCRAMMNRSNEPPPMTDIRVLSEWFERAAARGMLQSTDFRAIALIILSALHGPTMLTDLLGKHPTGHSAERYVEILTQTLLHGLVIADEH